MRPNSPDATARPDRRAAAHLLDVGRLLSRAGGGPLTGIDRVELAYLRELLLRGGPVWGILRVAGGWGLLDRAGLEAVAALARGERNGIWGGLTETQRKKMRKLRKQEEVEAV